jgi:hypothetical protein
MIYKQFRLKPRACIPYGLGQQQFIKQELHHLLLSVTYTLKSLYIEGSD